MPRATSRSKTRHNGHNLYTDITRIRNAFADTATDVKGKANEVVADSFKNIKQSSNRMQGSVARYTAKKPFKTIGLALLAGTVIGLLLRRK